jgi:hypothetical protein
MLRQLMFSAAAYSRPAKVHTSWQDEATSYVHQSYSVSEEGTDRDISNDMAHWLQGYAQVNAAQLLLDPQVKIEVHGFHPVFRVAPDGRLLIELVVQFAQKAPDPAAAHGSSHDPPALPDLGGVPLRGGTTLIASADGTIRYLIAKPLPSSSLPADRHREAQLRLQRQADYVRLCDHIDAGCAYCGDSEFRSRMRARSSLMALHQGALA